MDLSVIVEQEVVSVKDRVEDAERSTDSGVASTSGNSTNPGKDVMCNFPIIIEFKALNPQETGPKESTFVAKTNMGDGDCDISDINGEQKNRETLNSDGQ